MCRLVERFMRKYAEARRAGFSPALVSQSAGRGFKSRRRLQLLKRLPFGDRLLRRGLGYRGRMCAAVGPGHLGAEVIWSQARVAQSHLDVCAPQDRLQGLEAPAAHTEPGSEAVPQVWMCRPSSLASTSSRTRSDVAGRPDAAVRSPWRPTRTSSAACRIGTSPTSP